MTDPSSYIGRPLKRVEDPRLITGQGHYVDDLKLPGQAHLVFVRSPYAHARISSLNVEAARKTPGVIAVVTAKDLGLLRPPPPSAMLPGLKVSPHPYLAEDVVHVAGMPIAAIVAETGAMARDAADLVEVEYEPLPVVTDVEAALQPGAPLLHPELGTNQAVAHVTKGGDVAAAFASAAHTVKVRVVHNRLIGVPIEPRSILAHYDRGMDELTLWMTTQGPSRTRVALAVVLGFPETKIRVIAPEVGGAFGTKSGVYREDAVAAAVALQVGRPVKWSATRSEEFLAMTHGRAAVTEAEAAVTEHGRVIGLKARIIYNLGAHFNGRSLLPLGRHTAMITGAYRIEHAEVQGIGAYTNTGMTAPYRGAGRPEAALVIERMMDEVGRAVGLDPVEIRRRNFIPAVAFPFKTGIGTLYDSGDYEKTLNKLLELTDYPALRLEQAEARKRGEVMGIGLATYVEPSGGLAWESGLVRMEQTGKVTVATGSSPHGQGHETTFAQIVADYLGVPFEEIIIRHGDTLGVPRGIGTVGSRSAALGGSALVKASIEVREKGRRLAAGLLEASTEDVEAAPGGFHVKGSPDRKVSWARVAEFAYLGMRLPKGETPGLEATAFYNQEREMYGFGAVLALVRIDKETGKVHLERFFSVDDCGNVINPLLAHGQLEGGLVQGIGQALLEHVIYSEDGQLLSGSFMEYAMPRADDVPHFITESTVTTSPLNPLGVKGTGETGTVAAPPAILNAVVDALAPFGVRHLDMPLTPEKIWRALHSKEVSV